MPIILYDIFLLLILYFQLCNRVMFYLLYFLENKNTIRYFLYTKPSANEVFKLTGVGRRGRNMISIPL